MTGGLSPYKASLPPKESLKSDLSSNNKNCTDCNPTSFLKNMLNCGMSATVRYGILVLFFAVRKYKDNNVQGLTGDCSCIGV